VKSIIQTEKICYFCGAVSNLESHHIFFGEKNRKWSEKYGLKVWLCHYDHRDNLNGVHGLAAQKRKHLEMIGQEVFEKKYGHKKFMDVFGRNYLDGEEPQAEAVMDKEPPIRWLE
jgi:hypothetical protein